MITRDRRCSDPRIAVVATYVEIAALFVLFLVPLLALSALLGAGTDLARFGVGALALGAALSITAYTRVARD
jgi:hypothetical protein